MAIACYKYCDECAFFSDCKNVYGKGFPPCYNTIVKNFNSAQQLKDAIALLRKCVQQPNYQDRFSDLHAEVVSFVQHASV